MKEAIITGATGVIGMALVKKCIQENVRVTILANPDSKRTGRIPVSPLVRVIGCSVSDYGNPDILSAIEEGTKPSDTGDLVFFHLAWAGTFGEARNNLELQSANITYTLDAVELAGRLGCSAFVGVGSQAEYGRVEGVLKKDTPTNPENGYGCAKLKAGQESRQKCRELGIRHIWTRVLSIYGPFDGDKTMVMSTISALLDGRKPSLTKGEQMWDYLFADDAADAIFKLGESGVGGKIYPIGSGKARPLREYIEIIRDCVDPSLPLGLGDVPYSDKQVMYLCADISDLTKDTGFSPGTSFEDGIKQTIEYVRRSRLL